MTRSTKKGPFVEESLLKKIEKAKTDKKSDPIKTWSRKSMVTPDFVGLTLAVHNGKKFVSVFITEIKLSLIFMTKKVIGSKNDISDSFMLFLECIYIHACHVL